ncbi:unnamed protein product [Colias eurytheme]|nr:unnamed protein product [Colias eurytheme]
MYFKRKTYGRGRSERGFAAPSAADRPRLLLLSGPDKQININEMCGSGVVRLPACVCYSTAAKLQNERRHDYSKKIVGSVDSIAS